MTGRLKSALKGPVGQKVPIRARKAKSVKRGPKGLIRAKKGHKGLKRGPKGLIRAKKGHKGLKRP